MKTYITEAEMEADKNKIIGKWYTGGFLTDYKNVRNGGFAMELTLEHFLNDTKVHGNTLFEFVRELMKGKEEDMSFVAIKNVVNNAVHCMQEFEKTIDIEDFIKNVHGSRPSDEIIMESLLDEYKQKYQ